MIYGKSFFERLIMKTVAIIAEYNPFHKGHAYHLNQSLEATHAEYSIAVMGGNFLQRGQAAMWDKYTRGHMCVSEGIDLAIELPFPYATGSAMDFSTGAISIIDKLNTVDYLCFGAETSDMASLEHIASIILEEPDSYKDYLADFLSCGLAFPLAREKAITEYLHDDRYSAILSQPNNILAIEYICALKRLNSKIKPVVIQRKSAGYHDETLRAGITSATSIRNKFNTRQSDISFDVTLSDICNSVPSKVLSLIKDTINITAPIFTDTLTPFLQGKLISCKDVSDICDMSTELSNRLTDIDLNASYSEITDMLKTKDITHSRISRCLIHLLLNYTKTDRANFIKDNYAYYANILSFKKDSSPLIKLLHEQAFIPLITKKADFTDIINSYTGIDTEHAKKMWQLDTDATKLYNHLIFNTYGTKNNNDYTTRLPIV